MREAASLVFTLLSFAFKEWFWSCLSAKSLSIIALQLLESYFSERPICQSGNVIQPVQQIEHLKAAIDLLEV